MRSKHLVALAFACTWAIPGCAITSNEKIQLSQASPKPTPQKKRPPVAPPGDLYRVKFTPTGDVAEIRKPSGQIVLLRDFSCPQLPESMRDALKIHAAPPPKAELEEEDVKTWIDAITHENSRLREALGQAVDLNDYCSGATIQAD